MIRTIFKASMLLLVLAGPADSQVEGCVAPTNEDCGGAIGFTFEQLPLAVSGVLGCSNDMVDRPYFDVFFRYDCTVSGSYRFDMCGALGDTYMRIYTDGCGFGPASSWIEDDDGCGFAPVLDPSITTTLTAGTSYWIELGAWREDDFFPPNANDPYNFNVEYLDGAPSPWVDLENELDGGAYEPQLAGSGPLTAGTPVAMTLALAPPATLAHLVVSSTAIFAPFKGGVLVPDVELVFTSTTDGIGMVVQATSWPAGVPGGTTFYLQYWMKHPDGPSGWLASNALSGTTPP